MKFRLLLLVLTTPLIHSALYAAEPKTLSRAASTESHSLDLEKEVSEINNIPAAFTKTSRANSTTCATPPGSPTKKEKTRSESLSNRWDRKDYYPSYAKIQDKKDALTRYSLLKTLSRTPERLDEMETLEKFLNKTCSTITLEENDLYKLPERTLTVVGRGAKYLELINLGGLATKNDVTVKKIRELMAQLELPSSPSPEKSQERKSSFSF